MIFTGQFITQKDDIVTVNIITNNDNSQTVSIGDNTSGVFFAEDPVEISNENTDPTDVILAQSCTITLLSDHFIADLFQLNALNATVNILIGDKIVFNGFIEPQTYSQSFNEIYDELELNCISALSALQYIQYKNVGDNGSKYEEAKATAGQRTFYEVITEAINKIASAGAKVYFDGSVVLAQGDAAGNIFAQVSISELLFFDDDEDSIWTYEDVITEILRYFNLHIRQDGANFYIFNWQTIKAGATIAWINLSTSKTVSMTPQETTISITNVADEETTITVDESFNQIKVTCNRKETSEIAISPFDDDTLTAVFPKRTLYARQYQWGEDCGTKDAYNKLKEMVKQAGNYFKEDDNYYIYDWYVQVFRNTQWQTPYYGNNDYYTWNSETLQDERKDIYDLLCNNANQLPLSLPVYWNVDKNNTTLQTAVDPDMNGVCPAAAIIKFAQSENKAEKGEYGDVQELDETTYICIPCNGTSVSYNTDRYQTKLQKIYNDGGGLMICKSQTAGGTLSPADSGTINYIVISGKVLLQGVHVWQLSKNENIRPAKGTVASLNKTAENTLLMCTIDELLNAGTVDIFDPDNPLQKTKDNKWTGRIMRFYDSDGNPLKTANHLLPPFEAGKFLQFKYNNDHNEWDTIDKVAILDCMLKVGDKYCVETFYEYKDYKMNTRTKSKFQWLTEKECPTYTIKDDDGVTRTYTKKTFSIGIDPELDDYIIGEEHEFCNTVLASMNISAEGIAIPIKESDALSGEVEFRIIGPVNTTWNEVTRRHPTMFRHTKFTDTAKLVLDNTSCIYISDFKIGIYSDNGGVTNGQDEDLIYMSDEDASYRNEKECDEFKINTALTTNEAQVLGVKQAVCLSTPTVVSTNKPLLSIYSNLIKETAKPEQFYVDAYYTEFHTPKITMEQNFENPQATISLWNIYKHPALAGKLFYAIGASSNLIEGTTKLNLREI